MLPNDYTAVEIYAFGVLTEQLTLKVSEAISLLPYMYSDVHEHDSRDVQCTDRKATIKLIVSADQGIHMVRPL